MSLSDQETEVRRHCVIAKDRREAVGKLILSHPTLASLYSVGPNNDGKGGWVNAIRDQHASAYRLLFYLDRLPLAVEYREQEPYEVLFGSVVASDEPNYPRVLFTTTGGVNLMPDELPEVSFASAIKTDSLEIVPLSFDRDLVTARLRKQGYAYICIYDVKVDALRILDLKHYLEIYVLKEKQEVQVRNDECVIVSDAKLIRPFFLKYVIKRADKDSVNPSQAAKRMLGQQES